MTPIFNNPLNTAHLAVVANRWLGTPWCANSEACGMRGGVACHNLPRAILMECGALPADFPQITGDPNGTRHQRESVMEPWLDARPEFSRRSTINSPLSTHLVPGDVLGLRIYHCVDHLGLYLGDHQFIHVLMHKRTCVDSLSDPTWSSRLLAVWRVRNGRFTNDDLRAVGVIDDKRDSYDPFPLTPALSPAERENGSPIHATSDDRVLLNVAQIIKSIEAVPSPRGRG